MIGYFRDPVLAGQWLEAIWNASWQGGLALLAAFAICTAWRSLPPRAQCWIWRIAYIKLVVAMLWTVPLRLPLLGPEQPVRAPQVTSISAPIHPLPIITASPRLPPAIQTSSRLSQFPRWPTWLMLAWSLGAGVILIRLICQWRWAAALRGRCMPIEHGSLQPEISRIAATLGVRRLPQVLLSDTLSSPLLLGFVRPAIILPTSVATGTRMQRQLILAHELAHLRRRDLWWNVLPVAADLLFFFHPMIWLARRRFHLAQELACDQLVLESIACPPAEYANTLLQIARAHAAPTLALASGVVGSGKSLHKRISAMKHLSNWSKTRSLTAATAAALLSLAIIPPWRVVAQEQSNQAAPAKKEAAKADPPSAMQRLQERPNQEQERLIGTITAAEVQLSPAVDGTVRKVNAHDGDHVKAGQVLIELDNRRAAAGIAEAEAKLRLAQVHLERYQRMKDAGMPEEVEQARVELQVAQAELALRAQDLDDTRLTAPFDGTVTRLQGVAGQRVTKGQPLGEVVEDGKLSVAFAIPQQMIRDIKTGQKLSIWSQALPEQTFEASIRSISPIVNPGTGTISVQAQVAGHTDGLMSGMTVGIGITPDAARAK